MLFDVFLGRFYELGPQTWCSSVFWGQLKDVRVKLKKSSKLTWGLSLKVRFWGLFGHFSRFSNLTRSFLNVWSSNSVSGRILGCVNRCSENIEEIFKIPLPAGKKRPKNDCFSVIWRPLLPVLIIVVPVCILKTLNVVWIPSDPSITRPWPILHCPRA